MVEVNINLTLEEVTVDGSEVTRDDNIPLEDMESWLEVLYSEEEYHEEDVDVKVNINRE